MYLARGLARDNCVGLGSSVAPSSQLDSTGMSVSDSRRSNVTCNGTRYARAAKRGLDRIDVDSICSRNDGAIVDRVFVHFSFLRFLVLCTISRRGDEPDAKTRTKEIERLSASLPSQSIQRDRTRSFISFLRYERIVLGIIVCAQSLVD